MYIWICNDCGTKYGKYRAWTSTWHIGLCEWCGENKPVTEARDYSWPLPPDNKEKNK